MSPPISEHIGVVAYIEHALELLPEDPTQASVDDLGRVAAISEGLARHMLALRADLGALDLATRDLGEDPAEIGASVAERLRLETVYQRALVADEHFTTYTADALSAHGLNLDQLAGE
jgi:hypothetical protein